VFLFACEDADIDTPLDTDISMEDNADEQEEPHQEEPPEEEPQQEEQEEPIEEPLLPDDRTTLQVLLDSANEYRLSIEKVNEETVRELAYSRDFVFYDMGPLIMGHDVIPRMPPTVSRENAIKDVDVLFDALRYAYGVYQYFGGDEVFEPAREKILEELNQFDGSNLASALFSEIIHRYLSPIINDRHFFIGQHLYVAEYTFLTSDDIFFERSGQRFRNRESGLYIEEIVGYDVGELMRLQLNEYGHHFYAPVLQREGTSRAAYTAVIKYEDGTSEYLELRHVPVSWNLFQSPSNLIYVDGIPVVSLESMMGMSATPYGVYAHNFFSYAEEVRDKPVVILDIRSNTGGMIILTQKWAYLLTGEVIHGNYVQMENWNDEYEFIWTPWGDTSETNPFYFSDDDWSSLEFLFEEVTTVNGFNIRNLTERHIAEREQVLIVLIDRNTASAGEMFTDLIFNIENTIVIGQNTMGCIISNMAYPHLRLPNTRMPFAFGTSVFMWPEGHFAEGTGFAPNVWVTGCALTATLAMLKNEEIYANR